MKKDSTPPQIRSKTRRRFMQLAAGGIGAGALGLRVPAASAQNVPQPGLDDLIKPAKAEGGLTFYSAQTDNVNQRIAAAFEKTYGIKTQHLRLDSSPLLQRYSAEASVGSFICDMMIVAGAAEPFAESGEQKGWMESISKAGLPVLQGGGFPAEMNRGRTAIVAVSPWLFGYNTDLVKPADVPKTWEELFSPRWKGQVLVSDPNQTDAQLDFWAVLLDHYGEGFFDKVRSVMHVTGTIVEETNGLGAGDGALQVPVNAALVQGVKDKGAPIQGQAMDLTTGIQLQALLTDRSKAKHPASGRLFANWVLSPEGNKVFNADPGVHSIYESGGLPKDYEPPKPGVAARRDKIRTLLGFMKA